MNLRSLNKRLEQIEMKLGPASAQDFAFAATRERFLALLEDEPRYEFEIEPEFRRIQIQILHLRGKEFWDWDQEVTDLDPVEEYMWLISEGRALDLALLHIDAYFHHTWEQAERDIRSTRRANL